MKDSPRQVLLVLVVWAGVATNLAAKQKSSADVSHLEQTHLRMEEDPKRVVALPEEVLDLLVTDESVVREQSCAKRISEPSSPLFVATEIHLNRSQQPDFVVLGRGRLMGANTGPFWIVEKTPQGFRVLLTWPSRPRHIAQGKPTGIMTCDRCLRPPTQSPPPFVNSTGRSTYPGKGTSSLCPKSLV